MRRFTRFLVAAGLFAPASNAMGQSFGDAVAYLALVATPTADVAPVARQWMLSNPATGAGLDLQWGHVSADGGHVDTFTGGVTLPIASGRGDVGLSAGYFSPSCDGSSCPGNFVAGGMVEGRVLQSHMESATFVLGLSGRVGFAKPSGGTVWSAAAGVPLSLAVGSKTGVHVVPFVTPGFG